MTAEAAAPATVRGGRHRRGAADERPAPARRRPWPRAALASAVLLALTAVVALSRHDGDAAATAAARHQALAAARVDAPILLSYDYRSLRSDIAAATALTTGSFRGQYARTARQLLAEAAPLKAIVQASVGSAGVVSAGPDSAVVLLFVDQASVKELPGSTTPVTRIDQSRVRLTLTRQHGRWLVAAVAAL